MLNITDTLKKLGFKKYFVILGDLNYKIIIL